jgi:hypothetical protein
MPSHSKLKKEEEKSSSKVVIEKLNATTADLKKDIVVYF